MWLTLEKGNDAVTLERGSNAGGGGVCVLGEGGALQRLQWQLLLKRGSDPVTLRKGSNVVTLEKGSNVGKGWGGEGGG